MFDQKKKRERGGREKETVKKILQQRKLWWDDGVILCRLIPAVAVLLGATQCMCVFLFSGSKHYFDYLCLTCTSKVIIIVNVNANNWIGRKPPTLSEGFSLPDIQCI